MAGERVLGEEEEGIDATWDKRPPSGTLVVRTRSWGPLAMRTQSWGPWW